MSGRVLTPESSQVVFRYKNLRPYMLWAAIVISMFAAFVWLGIHEGGGKGTLVFIISYLVFFVVCGAVGLLNLMDIIVNDEGVHRVVGKKVLQAIRWTDIRVIIIFQMYSRDRRKVRTVLHIFPIDGAGLAALGVSKIVFGDDPMRQGKFIDLIALMNRYIALHNIKIESTLGGSTSYPSQLSTAVPAGGR